MKMIMIRWFAVCVIPVLLLLWFAIAPAKDATDYLLNGIILACAAVFLFKAALFAYIGARLRQDTLAKKHALGQMLSPLLLAGYVVYYFIR